MTNPIEDKWRDQAINEKVESLQKGNQTVSFTDIQIRELEDDLRNFEHKFISIEACRALLARVKAAEELAYETKNEHLHFIGILYREPEKDHSSKDCRICLNDEAWRKAAGKDGV